MRRFRALLFVLAVLGMAPVAQAQSAQPRIIAGSDVPISAYPWQVSLRKAGSFTCGGSIRDATHVLTAAHCVTDALGQPLFPSLFSVGYGSASLGSQSIVPVDSLSVPSQYSALVDFDESYDVAVLTLRDPIDLTGPNARAIPFAQAQQPKTTGNATVSGWGDTTEGGSISQTLKATEVPLRTDQTCSDEYGSDYVAARSVCAGGGSAASNNPDTCQGDSGGPLVVDVDPSAATSFVLLGLTSGGRGCGRQNTPGYYAWTQGDGIGAFIGAPPGPAAQASAPAPASTPPAGTIAARDTARPVASLASLRCTRTRRCSFRIRATDAAGPVLNLSASVSRRVRVCHNRGGVRVCRTRLRKKALRPKRVNGGFAFSAKLAHGSYKLTAVATDAAGNRSRALTRAFRVRG